MTITWLLQKTQVSPEGKLAAPRTETPEVSSTEWRSWCISGDARVSQTRAIDVVGAPLLQQLAISSATPVCIVLASTSDTFWQRGRRDKGKNNHSEEHKRCHLDAAQAKLKSRMVRHQQQQQQPSDNQ